MDSIKTANKKSSEEFLEAYVPESEEWRCWKHPKTGEEYDITLCTATDLSDADFEAGFRLIELTSAESYRNSSAGWKPDAKKKEMRLLDLKYFLVKHNDQLEGFVSFMPTHEDGYRVIYCYEIHLAATLRGTGLAGVLMQLLDRIGRRIPGITKLMLTCYTSNQRASQFYTRLGYSVDEYSPPPRILRNGTRVDSEYVILSKALTLS